MKSGILQTRTRKKHCGITFYFFKKIDMVQMKQAIYSLVIPFMLVACKSAKNYDVRSFMPGIYTRFSDHEMRTEYDTIRIEPISETGNNYRLVRSSYFQKKLDGKTLPWEYRKEEWMAIYNEIKRVLNETKKGKVISFAPERNALFVEMTEYKKLK